MKTTFLPAALAALLLPLVASAADAGQLVDVVATGHGSTVREATKAALRAAVEQVVGTIVDATTLVENDELIEDEILQYSAGMIESSKTIGEPKKSKDGFYTVKVKATVKKGQVEEQLRTASAVNVTLDGADLFARMTAAQDNLADAESMIKDVLAKHLSCVVAEAVPGENGKSSLDLDPKTGEVFANVRVRIDQAKYRQFVKEVLGKLGPMAEKSIPVQGTDEDEQPYSGKGDIYFKKSTDPKHPFGIIVLENPKMGKATVLFFDKNRWNAIEESLQSGSVAVAVTLLDSTGDQMAFRSSPCDHRETLKRKGGGDSGLALFGINSRNKNRKMGLVSPFLDGEFYDDGDGYYTHEDDIHDVGIATYKQLSISLGTFTADELKTAGKLEIKVGHMKDGQFVE